MLAGPIDYTPGIFDIKFDKYKKENQVNTTLAHQLAIYVVIYSAHCKWLQIFRKIMKDILHSNLLEMLVLIGILQLF